MRKLLPQILAIVSLLLSASIASQAQSEPIITRHMRNETTNGQAPSVGRLPAVATMQLDMVLALRHQPELG